MLQPVAAPNPPELPPLHYAPPPGPPPLYYSDPAPLYQRSRLDAPAVPPIYPQLAAQRANLQGPGAAPVTSMWLSIPRNTGVTGAIVSHVTLVLPTDLLFIDFFDRLLNEEELREAMFIGIGLTCRVWTRVVVMEIHNLKPAVPINPQKCKGLPGDETDENDELSTTLSFVKELRQLREHLNCARHPGRFCFVSPINGEHVDLNRFKLTLWAKKMFFGEASLHQPPSVLGFDHVQKKPRCDLAARPVLSWVPRLSTSISRVISPSVIKAPIDLTGDSDDEPPVYYLSIAELLANINCRFPLLNISQYLPALQNHGYMYVNMLENLTTDCLFQDTGVPTSVGKGRAVVLKDDEDSEMSKSI
ncbi:hypothetical protein B0H21DRAFT_827440 [Amylocystis lapponica]|nr:hypothetical protein B0H21DRAFT_827440 [Amylocystis lapponica]